LKKIGGMEFFDVHFSYIDVETLAQAKAEGRDPSDALKVIESASAYLPQFRDGKVPEWEDSLLTEEIFDAWWSIIAGEGYPLAALQTLRQMWEGASSMLPSHVRSNLVPWKSVLQFLERYNLALPR
jgi:hypothetical protein